MYCLYCWRVFFSESDILKPELQKKRQSRPKTKAPAKESAHFLFPYSSMFHSFHTPVFFISPCLMWKMLTCVWMLTIKNSFKLGKDETSLFHSLILLYTLFIPPPFLPFFLQAPFFTYKPPLSDLDWHLRWVVTRYVYSVTCT